jgi:hypothetical protein
VLSHEYFASDSVAEPATAAPATRNHDGVVSASVALNWQPSRYLLGTACFVAHHANISTRHSNIQRMPAAPPTSAITVSTSTINRSGL